MRATLTHTSAIAILSLVTLLVAVGCESNKSPTRPPAASGQRAQSPFAKLDQDGDGKLVASEVGAERWRKLASADRDGDQAVSEAEFDQRPRHPRPRR